MRYQDTVLHAAGFHNAVPEERDINNGVQSPTVLSTREPALTFWMAVLGPQRNDIIRITVVSADGQVFVSNEQVLPKDKVRQFLFAGRAAQAAGLPPGRYTGKGEVIRAGQVIQRVEKTLLVAALPAA